MLKGFPGFSKKSPKFEVLLDGKTVFPDYFFPKDHKKSGSPRGQSAPALPDLVDGGLITSDNGDWIVLML